MKTERILGLIPARAGSKGVPRKNIRLLANKSLIQRAFESAQQSCVLDRIVLSTDDPNAVMLASTLGLEAPFLRPECLAGDQAPMIDVVLHALNELANAGYFPDAVMLLQPTTPTRTSAHIIDAIDLLAGTQSVCSVMEIPKIFCPHHVMRICDNGMLDNFLPDGKRYSRRQDVPPAYVRDGTIYLTRSAVIRDQHSLYGTTCRPMVIPWGASINIDTEQDWKEAEHYFSVKDKESLSREYD